MARNGFAAACIVAVGIAILATAAATPQARAQDPAKDFPSKPITLVVSAPPGGTADIMARAVAEGLRRQTTQPIIIENKGGAGGNIAGSFVVKSPPDGYTLLVGHAGPLALNVLLFASMPYDVEKDLAPVASLAAVPILLIASPKSGFKTVADLLARARAKPGALNYGTQGPGTTSHLTMEMLKARAGVDLVHVPFKGSAPAMLALLSGDVDVMFDNSPTALPQVRGGSVVALGLASKERSALMPDIPTVTEQGVPGLESRSWFGMSAPAGTPPQVIRRLNAMVNEALRTPEMARLANDVGLELTGGSPEEFGAFMKGEIAKWGAVVKASGAKFTD